MTRTHLLLLSVLCAACKTAAPTSPTLSPEEDKAALEADYDLLCNATSRSAMALSLETADVVDQKREAFLREHLKTAEAIRLLPELSTMTLTERSATLRKRARAAGYVGECPLAEGK